MKTRIGSLLALLFIGTGTPICGLAIGSAEGEERMVEATLADYRQAWLDGDEQRVMDTLSEEVQLFIPADSGGKLEGKDAVRQFWFPKSDVSYPITGYEISGQEIYARDDLAVVTGKSRLDWSTVEAGTVTDQATSHSEFITVLRKENGAWRIFRQMYQMREETPEPE